MRGVVVFYADAPNHSKAIAAEQKRSSHVAVGNLVLDLLHRNQEHGIAWRGDVNHLVVSGRCAHVIVGFVHAEEASFAQWLRLPWIHDRGHHAQARVISLAEVKDTHALAVPEAHQLRPAAQRTNDIHWSGHYQCVLETVLMCAEFVTSRR